MIEHKEISNANLTGKIRRREVILGGNRRLKIYGMLNCHSGKRMNKENRVFFTSECEAVDKGFRPCGNCMKPEYKKWIYSNTK